MQIDWRTPQLVTQMDKTDLSGFFLQLVMHRFCSPLHRIGVATAVWEPSRASRAASPITILCLKEWTRISFAPHDALVVTRTGNGNSAHYCFVDFFKLRMNCSV